MPEQFSLALQITLLGMSLVFAAILLLWVLIAVIVRATSTGERDQADAVAISEMALKRQAAAAAVAAALAEEATREANAEPREFPLPPTAIVSAWQAVMRANMLNKRGQVR